MINLTPHAITVHVGGVDHTFPPSGTTARVATVDQTVGVCSVTGAPVITRVYGAVTGLPADGAPCIVSAMVLAAVPGMPGVYAPDTGPTAIRDDRAQIVAVTRLVAA